MSSHFVVSALSSVETETSDLEIALLTIVEQRNNGMFFRFFI